MLMDRIIGAITFREGVYAEVEKDTTFTSTAWVIVVVSVFLSRIGSFAGFGFGQLGSWALGAIVSTTTLVAGFAAGAWVVSWRARRCCDADVDFGEMVRTLGLASIWLAVGVVGIAAAISTALQCALLPVEIIAALLGLLAWVRAGKEALDLDWGPTIVNLVIGWAVMAVVAMATKGVLSIVGLSPSMG